jgi:hypothetical protein
VFIIRCGLRTTLFRKCEIAVKFVKKRYLHRELRPLDSHEGSALGPRWGLWQPPDPCLFFLVHVIPLHQKFLDPRLRNSSINHVILITSKPTSLTKRLPAPRCIRMCVYHTFKPSVESGQQIHIQLVVRLTPTLLRVGLPTTYYRKTVLYITACTVVQCSVMDDSAFLWEHAIFGPPPQRNPLTDRYEILHN